MSMLSKTATALERLMKKCYGRHPHMGIIAYNIIMEEISISILSKIRPTMAVLTIIYCYTFDKHEISSVISQAFRATPVDLQSIMGIVLDISSTFIH